MIKLLLPKFWYKKNLLSVLLCPLSLVYLLIIWLRRLYYRLFVKGKLAVPVIVVGNITVGGAGKTPLVICLSKLLDRAGYKVGIISRGYGRSGSKATIIVDNNTLATYAGDESVMIFRRTGSLVVVGQNRLTAAMIAIAKGCDVIISDDGLQHYNLPRDIEVVVIDHEFGFGNGYCLPAGPLRERITRLKEVDFVVTNFNTNLHYYLAFDRDKLLLQVNGLRSLVDGSIETDVSKFRGKTIQAVAGIGRPEKFFSTLRNLGLSIIEHLFPDHHDFTEQDLRFDDQEIVVMTEKDAVKCQVFAKPNFWCLEVEAKIDAKFEQSFLGQLKRLSSG